MIYDVDGDQSVSDVVKEACEILTTITKQQNAVAISTAALAPRPSATSMMIISSAANVAAESGI